MIGYALARRLGGQWVGGIIVETEAYLGRPPAGGPDEGGEHPDPASHSVRGLTRANGSMFGPAGRLYVYPIHTRTCVNIVTEPDGVGAAVLVRALQPVWGGGVMATRRRSEDDRLWTTGPGRLCDALAIDRRCDGIDPIGRDDWSLCKVDDLAIGRIISGPRIGISRAVELPYRFFVDGNRYVSGPASAHTAGRRGKLTIPT